VIQATSTHSTREKITMLSMHIKNSEQCFFSLEGHARLAF